MKEKTKVNVFGEERETWLDMEDLIALEDMLNISTVELLQEYLKGNLKIKDIRLSMPIVLRHAYPELSPKDIINKFDEKIKSGETSIFPFQTIIGMAIVQTGIFGRRQKAGEAVAPTAAAEKK